MNKESQRIKIAEACGLKVVSDGITHYLTPCILGTGVIHPDGKGLTYVPNYLNDLNAMHEAEKLLRAEDELWGEYCGHLVKNGSWFNAVDATAAQRAEAFLRTLNLWEEP